MPSLTNTGAGALQTMLQSNATVMHGENAAYWQRASESDWQSIEDAAGDAALSQFQVVARDNGLAGGLRTFARNGDFRLYVEDPPTLDLSAADKYLKRRAWAGAWQETARGSSPDSVLLFAVGCVTFSKGHPSRYAQVWQFDPKVANWGIRMLLLTPASAR
jgi:hypothetical protein